jgi:hypothetical protein
MIALSFDTHQLPFSHFWLGNYKDTMIDPQSNQAAYDFWCEQTRKRICDPKKADILAPKEPLHCMCWLAIGSLSVPRINTDAFV